LSARHKLNPANMNFCLLMGSWTWFVLAAIAIVAASVHPGDIRLRKTGRPPRPRRGRCGPGSMRDGPEPGPPEGQSET
jgi:hypothetical protein